MGDILYVESVESDDQFSDGDGLGALCRHVVDLNKIGDGNTCTSELRDSWGVVESRHRFK